MRAAKAYPTQWTTGRYLLVGTMVLCSVVIFERLISARYALLLAPRDVRLQIIYPWDKQGVRIDLGAGCNCMLAASPRALDKYFCEAWCDKDRKHWFGWCPNLTKQHGGCDDQPMRCRDVTGQPDAPVELEPPAGEAGLALPAAHHRPSPR